MMCLRGLVLLILFLPSGARRSIRIDDAQHGAQQQNNKLSNGLEVSAESQETFIPGGFVTGLSRRSSGRAGTLSEWLKQHGWRSGHFEPHRAAPLFRYPRVAKVALQAATGPEEGGLPPKEELEDGDVHAEVVALKAKRAELEDKRAELEAKRAELEDKDAAGSTTSDLSAPAVARTAAPTVASLCAVVDEECAARLGDRMERLCEAIVAAWSRGQSLQRSEIQRLKRVVKAAEELKQDNKSETFQEVFANARVYITEITRSDSESISLDKLWDLADGVAKTPVAKRMESRALTKATFKFLSQATGENPDNEDSDAEEVAVPGEGMVALDTARSRLRLLERHEAAGCVEYRLFASALSECDDLEAVASAPATLDNSSLKEQLWDNFSIKWIKSALGESGLLELLAAEDAEVREMLEEADGSELPLWPDVLLSQLFQSGPSKLLAIDDIDDFFEFAGKISFFPLLLSTLASMQGNIELFAIYYFAQHLARINLKALAAFEGKWTPNRLDQLVSQQEALLLKETVNDLLVSFGTTLLISFLLLLLAGGAIVSQLGPVLSNILFPQQDPFAIF